MNDTRTLYERCPKCQGDGWLPNEHKLCDECVGAGDFPVVAKWYCARYGFNMKPRCDEDTSDGDKYAARHLDCHWAVSEMERGMSDDEYRRLLKEAMSEE